MEYNSLTSKQKKVFSAIECFIKTNGIPPTVREIGELIGERTPGAVQGILNRLEQKGVITRKVGMARSIQLTSDISQYDQPVYIPHIRKISKRNISDLLNIYNINKYQPVPKEFLAGYMNCFMINNPDFSDENKYPNQEDILVICTDCELKDGDYALVLYDNHILLRQYFCSPKTSDIILKAENSYIDKHSFKRDEITIAGKVIGKFTRLGEG